MINQIKEDIWQLHFKKFGSCVYVLKIGSEQVQASSAKNVERNKKIILIDTSSHEARQKLLDDLKKLQIKPEEVCVLIITHNHYDHVENIELFQNAKIYHPEKLNETSITKAKKGNFCINSSGSQIKEIPEMKVIETPGHSPESRCYLYQDILFSGDTLFHDGFTGRTDLPGSSEQEMTKSLEKLKKIKFKILCPGHI